MILDCLPMAILDAIMARLTRRERHRLTSSSKKLANDVWRHSPAFRVRFPLTDCTQTLRLFLRVDSVLPSDTLIRKVTQIAQDPHRQAILRHWINTQRVGIDAGGFYTPNEGYSATDMARIRIGLWDRPLGVRHRHYHHGPNYGVEEVTFLLRKFVEKGYNP